MDVNVDAPISIADCFQYLDEKIFSTIPLAQDTKPKSWPGKVGIELEMLAIKETQIGNTATKPEILPLFSFANVDAASTMGICEKIASEQDWRPIFFSSEAHETANTIEKIEINPIEAITFEPGGQLEFSTKPFDCLLGASKHLEQLQKILREGFAKYNAGFLQIGLNPWYEPDEIGLQMKKRRYIAMDQFFAKDGVSGSQMMRQTMSIQVCLDYGDRQQQLARRYIAANHLAPIAAAMFAYSPIVSGKVSPYKSARIAVWKNLDPTRTGFPIPSGSRSKIFDRAQIIDAYLNFALAARVIYVAKKNYAVPNNMSFAAWMAHGYQGVYPSLTDFVNHLSLLFPEVRPKGFLEIRSTDCLPQIWQDIPASFYLGLIYDEENLSWLLDYFGETSKTQLHDMWQRAAYGLRDKDLKDHAVVLIKRAIEGLQRLPACFFSDTYLKKFALFAEHFTGRGLTPADDLLAELKNYGQVDLALFKKVEKYWRDL